MADRTFEKVAVLGAEGKVLDSGTMTAYEDRLELDGKKTKVIFPDVRGVEAELPKIRVTHGKGSGLSVSYIMKITAGFPKKVREANRVFYQALHGIYGGMALSEAEQQHMARAEDEVREAKLRRARRSIWIGALLAIGGLLLTVITYSSADAGDSYLIAWGPVVAGVATMIGGLWESRKHRKAAPTPVLEGPAVPTTPARPEPGPAPVALPPVALPEEGEPSPGVETTRPGGGFSGRMALFAVAGALLLGGVVLGVTLLGEDNGDSPAVASEPGAPSPEPVRSCLEAAGYRVQQLGPVTADMDPRLAGAFEVLAVKVPGEDLTAVLVFFPTAEDAAAAYTKLGDDTNTQEQVTVTKINVLLGFAPPPTAAFQQSVEGCVVSS
jgi:hypothetical protein